MTLALRLCALAVLSLTVACNKAADIETVPVGAEVAVTRQDGGVVQGTLVEKDAQTVKVNEGRTVRTVPRDQIADVQVVHESTPVVLPAIARFREYTLPANTTLHIRLDTAVSSDSSKVEDAITGTLVDAVVTDGVTVLPVGSTLKGEVTAVESSGKVKGRASLALRFRTLRVQGHDDAYNIRVSLSRVAPATKGEDATKIGIPTVGGAILGGILGGKKGAVIGGVIGGGAGTAVVLTTEGREVELPAGTLLTLTLDQPVDVRVPLGKG